MSYCRIHGSYDDYFNDGCRNCQLAEDELKTEVSHAAYKAANPGDHECPHCGYVTLKAGKSRCPICRGEVGREYWNAEAKRQEGREAAAVLAKQEAAVAKQEAAAADLVAFDKATRGIRGRLLASAFVVAALWLGVRYPVWLPDAPPKYVSATFVVLSQYVGATLGAAMVFIGFALLVPRFSREGVAVVALIFLVALELSQLHGTQWLDDLRVTWLGGLVLGHGFRWSHLVCYAIGVLPLAAEEGEGLAFGRLLVTLLCSGGLIFLWQIARS
jgi:uncharacterized Zn finger protein (UPF0148 family)